MSEHTHPTLNRHERQRQLNLKLSVLPAFTPVNDYETVYINRQTSKMLLPDLIQMARRTTRFTIDTEHDYYTHQPALIQIEMIRTQSVVLLIETCHLPHSSSVLFWLIKSLLKVIFQPSNMIYAWGDAKQELVGFLPFNLFPAHAVQQLNSIDLQHQFKRWYNRNFPHNCGLSLFAADDRLCTCLHRPVKEKNNAWSLQKAIAYTFNQFLDKSRTKSAWSRSLDIKNIPRHSVVNRDREKALEQLVLYAVNDCLAVTKLSMIIGKNHMVK